MARRIKEEPSVHQNRIADEAEKLFHNKGIIHTTMDDVAKAAGYSKATLYVYFKNKDEIVSFLAKKSMILLKNTIITSIENMTPGREQFFNLCNEIYNYAVDYPEYFHTTTQTIQLDNDGAVEVGESINQAILSLLNKGSDSGVFKSKEYQILDVLHLWSLITGIIVIATQKEEYINSICENGVSEFLNTGFEKIYQTLET